MNEAAIFTAQKIFQQDAEGKGQFRECVDAVFFQLFEAMNLKGLRADVELFASAERIDCRNGHSLSFRVSAQLYIIAENKKRRGWLYWWLMKIVLISTYELGRQPFEIGRASCR